MSDRNVGNVSVRFSVQDAEVVRKALESLGKDGEGALNRLNAGSRAPSVGLKALSAVIGDIKGQATGFAVSLGTVGTGLIALGPQGLVAGAVIGAIVAAFGRLKDGARDAAMFAREVKDGAEEAGLSIPVYQALLDQLQAHGVSGEVASRGLNKFAVESKGATAATGEFFQKLKEIDPELARAFALARDQGERLAIFMQALAKLGTDAAARAALAAAAFGKGGTGIAVALQDIAKSGASIDEIAARLQKLGIVIDKDVIEKLAKAGVESERVAKQVSHNWDLAFANVWQFSKDAFAGLFGFKSGLAFSEWIKSFTDRLRPDAPDPNAPPGMQPVGPAQITVGPSPASDYAKRQQAITALKLEIDTERERLGLLGELATKSQQLKLIEDEVTLALLQRKPISDADAEVIKQAAAARLASAETAKRLQFGVATEEERRTNFVNDLNLAISKGTISETERAGAMALYEKTLKETIEAEKVRASSTPQLTRLAIDADNLTKSLDSELSSALRGTTSDLVSMAKGTETLGQGLTNLSAKLLEAVANAMLMKTLVGPLAGLLNGGFGFLRLGGAANAGTVGGTSLLGFGGLYAAGGDLSAGGWGVVGERGAELIKAHQGGGVTIFPNRFLRGLPGFASGGHISPFSNGSAWAPGAECGEEGGFGELLS